MITEYEPFLTPSVKNDLVAHMDEAGEDECCGMITLSGGKYVYEPAKNVSLTPRERITFCKKDRNRIVTSKTVVAYSHSHPRGPSYPSQMDQITQAHVKKPAVIVARDPSHGQVSVFSHGDHVLDAPLDRRVFRHAVFDCYEAIRSLAWQTEKRLMPAFPRVADWWKDDIQSDPAHKDMLNLYMNFDKAGYRKFDPNFSDPTSECAPKFGDVILMKLGAGVINHAGVYIGNNQMYHHPLGRRSGEVAIGYVMDHQLDAMWVRHESRAV